MGNYRSLELLTLTLTLQLVSGEPLHLAGVPGRLLRPGRAAMQLSNACASRAGSMVIVCVSPTARSMTVAGVGLLVPSSKAHMYSADLFVAI